MARAKTSEIPHYELLYIVSNKYTEDELAPIMDKTRKVISDNGGNITYSEEWGKKRFAYPIKHFQHGYYTLIEFDLDGDKLAEINRSFRMTSEILRYQIVRKQVKTAADIEQDKKIAAKIAAKATQEKEEGEKRKDKKDKQKVDLKELDKKLDKILEADDLL